MNLATHGAAPRWLRLLLLAAAMGGLLLGMWAGLLRMGWPWPVLRPVLPMLHGPLMACGFLGVLIGLERAVGTGWRWAYAGPALVAAGTLVALAGVPGWPSPLLVTLGSLVVTAVLVRLVRIQPALFTVTMAAGGAAWVGGNLLWLARFPLSVAALWWMGFLVLTIAGERLELSRLLRLSRLAHLLFIGAATLLIAGIIVSVVAYAAGMALTGAALIGLSLWLLHYDIARRRVKAGGQARFTALALLSGYGWLAVGGVLAMLYAGVTAGPTYDAILHSVFLGFVFAMIFAHAPIVFPAVLGVTMAYSARFYAPLVLLHASLLLRVAGDLTGWWQARLWGGLLNAVVILLFLGSTLLALRPKATAAVAAPPAVKPTPSH